ncbi:MAG: hypothetical protein JXR72_02980 [Proteobacteria bacterium]|nr:hypothetical protein [Pseudomonadota bacterium]
MSDNHFPISMPASRPCRYSPRKPRVFALGWIILLFGIFPILSCAASGTNSQIPKHPWVPGELLVAFQDDIPEERIAAIVLEEGGRIGRPVGKGSLLLILLPEETDIPEAARRFSSHPEVRYAEPNYRAILLERE